MTFDPNQPRDEGGRWTSGGGSAAGTSHAEGRWSTGNLNLDKNGFDAEGNPGPAVARRGGALWLYRGSGSDINDQLRAGRVTEPAVRDGLDRLMRPIGEESVLIRDLGDGFESPAVGTVFEEKGYTSTASSRGSFAKGRTIRIEVPANAPVIRIGDYYRNDPEKEVILARDSKFKVIAPNRWRWVE